MKKREGEVAASIEEVTATASGEPESNAPPEGVIGLSNDESEDLIASLVATTNTSPYEARPSTPWVTVEPNTSGDLEFTQKLFVELN